MGFREKPDANTANRFVAASCFAESSRGKYVDASKPVALLGVENFVIVDTADALLVANRSGVQEASKIVKALKDRRREELL
jgi:mannose-1-phosphate guanylyltransferase